MFLIKEFNLPQVPFVDEDLWEFCLHLEAHCQEEYFVQTTEPFGGITALY